MKTSVASEQLLRCYGIARDALLAERTPAGHWVGELSTSALSTATAVMALEMMRRAGGFETRMPEVKGQGRVESPESRVQSQNPAFRDQGSGETLNPRPSTLNPRRDDHSPLTTHHSPLTSLIQRGIDWLAAHQNADGGWGDAAGSLSNVSTTMLARASFHATGNDDRSADVVEEAAAYIERAGGVPAVLRRYGKDRTFSVPILTHCALAGLVDWEDVLPLPFELACLPPRFYKTLRLPVVSYALPALIAIGQVRHHFRKPRNPLTRLVRNLTRKRSLKVLARIQPANGGFLEAAPLTSFVTMSLAGMGLADHPVARKGAQFLIDSVRPDGSWPIDTNLATWVTTLSVNALGDDLPEEAREPILNWLLDQQYKQVHPYTNADPGGWAWTNLPGGVPDADDTSGAILAVLKLSGMSEWQSEVLYTGADGFEVRGRSSGGVGQKSGHVQRTLSRAVHWLLDLQNRDGGWPTFCRGWGKLPFDRSAPDLTAHSLRAIIRWFEPTFGIFPGAGLKLGWWLPDQQSWRPYHAIHDGFLYLERTQQTDGSWLPLWFGNQHAEDDRNPTYGTARVLAVYRDNGYLDTEPAQRGLQWLKSAQNADGGWGGDRRIASSVEETALAIEILLSAEPQGEAARRGLEWLCRRVEDGTFREPSPIGFYFARLWYFEKLYPIIFTVAALRRAVEVFGSSVPGAASVRGAEGEPPRR